MGSTVNFDDWWAVSGEGNRERREFCPTVLTLGSWGKTALMISCCDSLFLFFSFFLSICLFIYLWLCWVFVSVRGLSLVVASGGHSSSRCAGLSLLRPLLLWSTGSRRAGSVIVAHGPSCSAARGIFPDQGSNPCPLHWQADSQPLRHQGSPGFLISDTGYDWLVSDFFSPLDLVPLWKQIIGSPDHRREGWQVMTEKVVPFSSLSNKKGWMKNVVLSLAGVIMLELGYNIGTWFFSV